MLVLELALAWEPSWPAVRDFAVAEFDRWLWYGDALWQRDFWLVT